MYHGMMSLAEIFYTNNYKKKDMYEDLKRKSEKEKM